MTRLKRWLNNDDHLLLIFKIDTGIIVLSTIILLALLVAMVLSSCTYEINVRVVQPDQLPVTVDSPTNDTRSM